MLSQEFGQLKKKIEQNSRSNLKEKEKKQTTLSAKINTIWCFMLKEKQPKKKEEKKANVKCNWIFFLCVYIFKKQDESLTLL